MTPQTPTASPSEPSPGPTSEPGGLVAPPRRVLLTGATGYVGRYLHPALAAAGHEVRCATRHIGRARKEAPDRTWVELDLDRPETIGPALQGCDAAFYLARGPMTGSHPEAREAKRAEAFGRAAREQRLDRVVYLGDMEPQGSAPRQVESRLETGRILRETGPSTVELRAAMIIGAGSNSWKMMSDLAAHLPAMLLPRWTVRHSWPVSIDDVVLALLVALELPAPEAGCYDVPGPEDLSHRLLLERIAAQLGAHPPMWNVPVALPRLSAVWVAAMTRLSLRTARDLIEAMRLDVEPTCPLIWEHVPGHHRMPLEEATAHALIDERHKRIPSERARAAMEALGATSMRQAATGASHRWPA